MCNRRVCVRFRLSLLTGKCQDDEGGDAEGKFFMFGYFYIIPPPVYTFDVSSRLSLVSLC